MAYLIAFGILALIGIGASAWLIRTDGHGRVPTDPHRLPGGTDLDAPREARAPEVTPAPAPAPEVAPAPSPATSGRVRRAQPGAAARA
ncbi:hypothetical protein M3D75_01380 [Microbacterium enclense]|uniref:hypothetical protein n=1 Tax=Microbacterium enclense TaxID=993073 RepID=UPI0021A5DCAC|nr:hypothetical protein [Microbacterium enclense]MCT2084762.1 hypothetical protein [Microbacterium enclense]